MRRETPHVVASLATSRRSERNVTRGKDSEREREGEREREIPLSILAPPQPPPFPPPPSRACEKEFEKRERRRNDFLAEFSRLKKSRDRYRESSISRCALRAEVRDAILRGRERENEKETVRRKETTGHGVPACLCSRPLSPLSSRSHFSSPSSHLPLALSPSLSLSSSLARSHVRTFARRLSFSLCLVQRTVRLAV